MLFGAWKEFSVFQQILNVSMSGNRIFRGVLLTLIVQLQEQQKQRQPDWDLGQGAVSPRFFCKDECTRVMGVRKKNCAPLN